MGPRCGWLQHDGVMVDEAAAQATPPLETLEAHLALLHTPQHSLAWLPLYDHEDTPLLERLD